jgi:hypothetical protein
MGVGPDGQPVELEPFMCGIQTRWQRSMLAKLGHGANVEFDCTFGTNKYMVRLALQSWCWVGCGCTVPRLQVYGVVGCVHRVCGCARACVRVLMLCVWVILVHQSLYIQPTIYARCTRCVHPAAGTARFDSQLALCSCDMGLVTATTLTCCLLFCSTLWRTWWSWISTTTLCLWPTSSSAMSRSQR